MPETTIVCPYCSEELVTEDEVQGASIDCPSCGKAFAVAVAPVTAPAPGPRPPIPPPIAPSAPRMPVNLPNAAPTEGPQKSSIIRAGWICFGCGVLLTFALFLIPIWAALFLASLALGITATAKSQKGGIVLLVVSLAVPPILACFMFLVILGGCAAAVDSEMKKKGMQMPKRPPAGFVPKVHSPPSSEGARQ